MCGPGDSLNGIESTAPSEDATTTSTNSVYPGGAPRADFGLLIAGVTLVGIGGILGLTGLSVGVVAVLKAFRRTIRESDVPPTELAKRKLAQALAAATAGATAGAGAWRQGSQIEH